MRAYNPHRRPIFPTPAPATLPLAPAIYITLRREAHGLTRDDVAVRLCSILIRRQPADRRPRHLLSRTGDARALIDQLETPGVKARHRDTIDLLATIVGFDAAVYWQLAGEPADRHPHVCLACGCSAHDPCHGPLGICSLGHDSCSRCDDALAGRRAA